jgi:CIC family chloride channel protein
VQQFEHRIAIAALCASATAIAVARVLTGDAPDFHVAGLGYSDAGLRPICFVFGALAGLLAIAFNRTLLATISVARRLTRIPVEVRAALVGMAAGILAWFSPDLVGGGDAITQSVLAGDVLLVAIPGAFLVRFAFGTVSYAVETPGGLFAPLLVLGAQFGYLSGMVSRFLVPYLNVQPEGFAVVGLAAFFAGVVRAPITGIVLATEMTASVSMLLPMLCACATSMLIPTLLKDPPIYESLRERSKQIESRN